MGLIKGITAISKSLERADHSESAKGRWVKLEDKGKVKMRLLQELDPDSPNYDEELGLGFIAVEHTNPTDWKRKALCSIEDQGRCYGCEQARKEPKSGWRGKKRFYINVLVDDSVEEPYVAILSQGAGGKSATQSILEYAAETGSVTDLNWTLKRNGTGTDTSYVATPLPAREPLAPISGVELFDLEKSAVRDVPYEEQAAFYTGLGQEEPAQTSVADEW